jgi:hypothetical protein
MRMANPIQDNGTSLFSGMSKEEFKDTQFLSAEEKLKVLRAWKKFVTLGPELHLFTQTLYRHLMQHCSFIAHYDRMGFYNHYFSDPEMTLTFFKQFDVDNWFTSVEYGDHWWYENEDNGDLARAMCNVFELVKKETYEELYEKIVQKYRD